MACCSNWLCHVSPAGLQALCLPTLLCAVCMLCALSQVYYTGSDLTQVVWSTVRLSMKPSKEWLEGFVDQVRHMVELPCLALFVGAVRWRCHQCLN